MSANPQKVYLPPTTPREQILLGELTQVRSRLDELLEEVDELAVSDDDERWDDVVLATRVGLRAITTAISAVPPAPVRDPENSEIEVDGLCVDPLAQRAWYRDTELVLTPLQHKLLATMIEYPARRFTKNELLRDVWGYREKVSYSNAPSAAISRLRRILVDAGAPAGHFLIHLHHGGWTLTDPRRA